MGERFGLTGLHQVQGAGGWPWGPSGWGKGFRVSFFDRNRTHLSGVLASLVLCGVTLLTPGAALGSAAAVPKGCPTVRAHTGKTSGDWEVVFGQRRNTSRAVQLLRRVRRKGFRCAVIERERRTREVAVVGLHTQAAAERRARRAHRARLHAFVAQS